jgi:hypothetical protein
MNFGRRERVERRLTAMANHGSARERQPYDRWRDEVSLDEIKRTTI